MLIVSHLFGRVVKQRMALCFITLFITNDQWFWAVCLKRYLPKSSWSPPHWEFVLRDLHLAYIQLPLPTKRTIKGAQDSGTVCLPIVWSHTSCISWLLHGPPPHCVASHASDAKPTVRNVFCLYDIFCNACKIADMLGIFVVFLQERVHIRMSAFPFCGH